MKVSWFLWYNCVMDTKHTTSCGTVPFRFGRTVNDIEILLVKQFAHRDVWGIPKGHVDAGETIEQCAIRETREEAGIDVSLTTRLPDARCTYKHHRIVEEKVVISFLAYQTCVRAPASDDPDSEVADVQWFNIGDLPKVHAYQRELVEDAVLIVKAQFMIIEALKTVHSFVDVDDWIVIKKELLKTLPAGLRRAFSTRDPITKRQHLNDFERRLMERWSEMTGRPCIFNEDDISETTT